MKVKLLDWQKEVANDPRRFKVICAGRRAGKSVYSRMQVLKWALENKGLYWIVSPTYKQSKQIHWRDYAKEIPRDWIEKKNEVELSVLLKNGSIIELKGAENPDALRGVKLRGLCIDEIASIRNWDWLWHEVLRPTLTDYQAPALFISTPKGFNHFFDLYEQGQRKEGDYKSWKFTSYDNATISKEELDGQRKDLTEDTFSQEYLADFRQHTGLAHKTWSREHNLIEPFIVPNTWSRFRGFDYGLVDFTASVRIAVDDQENMFVESSYLDNHSSVKEHAEAIRAEDYGLSVICWGDPSGRQWVEEFAMHGLHIQDANKTVGQGFKGWVEYCVERVNELLKPVPGHKVYLPGGKVIENAPRMFVLNNGKNDKLVSQIERLSWRETATGDIVPMLEDTGDPTGGHYDLLAALRYYAVSYSKPMTNIDLPKEQLFSGGFY